MSARDFLILTVCLAVLPAQAESPVADSAAAIREEISSAYYELRTRLVNEDESIRELLLTFDRVLPGSGPQRLRGRFYYTESQAEVAGGVAHIATPRRAEISFNVAASELRYEILWMDNRVRFIHEQRPGPEDKPMERRYYFNAAGKLAVLLAGAPNTKRRPRTEFLPADLLLAQNALRLARRAGAAFHASIEIPGSL